MEGDRGSECAGPADLGAVRRGLLSRGEALMLVLLLSLGLWVGIWGVLSLLR